ncbi:MAG: HDOD domain-containing protein [Thioalkalivibrio sp.]
MDPSSPGVSRDAGEGLRDVDLATLYSMAPIKVLEPDTLLFTAGERIRAIHLLIKGAVELQDGTGATLMEVGAGDWIGNLDFGVSGPHYCSAVARGPASVLSLDREIYDGLGDELRLRLLAQLHTQEHGRMFRLTARGGALQERNQALVQALFRSRAAADSGFSRSEAVRQVIQKVPRLPVSTATLLGKLFDEKSTHAEVVELVKSDPSLTSTLLKAINSPLYGLQHKIDNVNHAVTLLGFDGVHQLVLSESLRKSLPETPRFLEIYHRALDTSQLAFASAQATGIGHPAELSTIGLLHEVGSVVLELLKTQNPRLEGLLATMDSAGLGAELLRAWNLPERLCKTIEFRHYPEFALPEHVPTDVVKNVALLHLAHRFQRRIHAGPGSEHGPFVEEYMAALGLAGISETDLFEQRVKPRLLARAQTLPRTLAAALAS